MPRPHRIEVAGGVYHVGVVGAGRIAIYRGEDDRALFLAIYQTVLSRYGWIPHLYCLMTTHFHLLVETPQPNLARGMQRLNGTYAQTFNGRYDRDGHLFGGRYWSARLESEEHYNEAWHYIAYNPVRAGICARPQDWPWTGVAPGRPLPVMDLTRV